MPDIRISRRTLGACIVFMVVSLLVSFNLDRRIVQQRGRTVEIEMSIAEQGGFAPVNVRVRAGEPVRLRLHAGDVAHAVAVGPGLDVDTGIIARGESRDITLTFDRPGVYTYYCSLWCSKEHWRMRGVIEVMDSSGRIPPAPPDPVIAVLTAEGVDIDAASVAGNLALEIPASAPSTPGTAVLATFAVPEYLQSTQWRRTHALVDTIDALAEANPAQSGDRIVAASVALWLEGRSSPVNGRMADLYTKNCAACHGARGTGDGPAAVDAASTPAAFTMATLADRRSDVLYAKIRRGGMGTGMPNFGTLFTSEETWSLVDYLWLLALGAGTPAGR